MKTAYFYAVLSACELAASVCSSAAVTAHLARILPSFDALILASAGIEDF